MADLLRNFEHMMNCARLHLHERIKPRVNSGRLIPAGRPRRYCQKRMVNPEHDEDPRWTDVFERFHCNESDSRDALTIDSFQHNHEDLFLSVQNLKFNGNVMERKRPKTCFKYKALTDGNKHRMFVKQIVSEESDSVEECPSQLTYYYLDDYVKYILNPEKSEPPSEKSSMLLLLNNKVTENKAVQVGTKKQGVDLKKGRKSEIAICTDAKQEETGNHETDFNSDDTKIMYHKSGKRKCLTISRAQSPETVQVIRVDVVCNYSRSPTSDIDDNAKLNTECTNLLNDKLSKNISIKKSHFANKYLLTNTTKTLDENVSGGAKVTLLCKTFRLSKRSRSSNKKPNNTIKVIK